MKLLIIATLLVAVVSCTKSDSIPANIPSCIKEKIEYHKNNTYSTIGEVDEYLFQGKLVYIFSDDHTRVADGGASIFNADCTSLCYLGGIIGITTCNGEDFSQKAVLQRVIWKK